MCRITNAETAIRYAQFRIKRDNAAGVVANNDTVTIRRQRLCTECGDENEESLKLDNLAKVNPVDLHCRNCGTQTSQILTGREDHVVVANLIRFPLQTKRHKR